MIIDDIIYETNFLGFVKTKIKLMIRLGVNVNSYKKIQFFNFLLHKTFNNNTLL